MCDGCETLNFRSFKLPNLEVPTRSRFELDVTIFVFEYSEFVGYGEAAVKLQRHWNRNPDTLPFAQHVRRHALISIVQDALFLDELQAKATSQPRRHLFINTETTPPQSPRRASSTSPDRSATTGRKRPSLSVNDDAANHVQPPPAKRRKSRGVEPQLNGDAMDVDTNGYTNGHRDPTPSDQGSPVPVHPTIRPPTLEHGTSTGVQTEKPSFNHFGETTYIEIEDLFATVVHTDWSPDDPNLLLTAGESICKLWSVPMLSSATSSPIPIDLSSDLGGDPSEAYMVTSTCWGPHQGDLYLAVETVGRYAPTEHIVMVDTNTAATVVLATTSETTIDIKCHPKGWCLIRHCVTHQGDEFLQIWRQTGPGHEIFPGSRHKMTRDVRDLAWLNDNEFVMCGHDFISRCTWTAEQGIIQLPDSVDQDKDEKSSGNYSWDIATSDPERMAAAFASIDTGRVGVIRHELPMVSAVVSDCRVTAIKFKPDSTQSNPSLLAASYTDGNVRLWTISETHANGISLGMNGDHPPQRQLQCARILSVGLDILPNALTFSPNGFFIAAATERRVQIWATDRGWPQKATWTAAEDSWKGSDGDEDAAGYAGLSWDADGRRLALTLHKQIAIIRFQR